MAVGKFVMLFSVIFVLILRSESNDQSEVSRILCDGDSGMSDGQKSMCRANKSLFFQMNRAGQKTISTCRGVFVNDTETCHFLLNDDQSLVALWIDNGSKEAALISALRAAFSVMEIASGCDEKPNECICGPLRNQKMRHPGRYRYLWQGCVDGVKYASDIVTRWINIDNGPRLSRDWRMAKHNEQVGIQIVNRLFYDPSRLLCHNCTFGNRSKGECCVGSCSRQVPSHDEVARLILNLYANASSTEEQDLFPPGVLVYTESD